MHMIIKDKVNSKCEQTYAIFSTIGDQILLMEANREELVKFYVDKEVERINNDIDSRIKELDKGIKSSFRTEIGADIHDQAVEVLRITKNDPEEMKLYSW